MHSRDKTVLATVVYMILHYSNLFQYLFLSIYYIIPILVENSYSNFVKFFANNNNIVWWTHIFFIKR